MLGYEDYFSDIFFLCERDCLDGDNSKQSCLERILSSPPPCVSHLDEEERKRIVDSLYSPKNISLYGGYLEEGLNETHFVSGSELSQKAKEDIEKLNELCSLCCESLKKYPLPSLSQKKALPLIESCIKSNYSTLAPQRVRYLSEYILERFLLD